MKQLIARIEQVGISIHEYKEGKKLCGYELNTYTEGGVNQIIFVDFRNTNKKPKNAADFRELFLARVNDIDIDEEIDLHREMKDYKQNFTITQSLIDFSEWKEKLLTLANSI